MRVAQALGSVWMIKAWDAQAGHQSISGGVLPFVLPGQGGIVRVIYNYWGKMP